MFKGVIIFAGGVYAGIYAAQNYPIDKVENPKVLFGKLQSLVQSNAGEKPPEGKK